MALHLRPVDPRQGARWLRHAFSLYFRRPLAFSGLFILCLFGLLLLSTLPYVGVVLVVMSLPLISLGFMIATRSALQGGAVHPGHLLEPLRPVNAAHRRNLLQLCSLYALATVAIVWVSGSVDGGRFERLQALLAQTQAPQAELEALLADNMLYWGLGVRLTLAALLSVPFWHAPALVHWGGQGVAQSLFSSTLACWRTRGAFVVYGMGWLLVASLFGLLVGGLFTALGLRQLAAAAVLPAGLLFSTVFYVSLYFTFADTFGIDRPEPSAPSVTT